VGSKRHIDVAERRARLGRRQLLTPSARATSPLEVARGLVALHGTDPATVYLSAAVRLREPDVGAIDRALYDDRVLVRMLGMRRTMFVVPVDTAPVIQASCTQAIAAQERRRYLQMFAQAGVADDMATWSREVEQATLEALRKRGEASAQELGKDVPELRRQILLAEGKSYAALQSVSTRILFVLSAEGHIVRARPRGSFISGQVRWAPLEAWLPGGFTPLDRHAAQVELVRMWLESFGPGTLADLKWWTGWTMGDVKRVLEHLDVVEVHLGEMEGFVLAEHAEPVEAGDPWVALLPALDPTPMGFTERSWFLGAHAPRLFDRSGNIGPSIWFDGRIVGGWAQRKNGPIAYKLLEDVGSEAEKAVEAAAHQLSRWLGAVRVTPRFRTPLERELSA
jgi:Winged helix DNA-binding domain